MLFSPLTEPCSSMFSGAGLPPVRRRKHTKHCGARRVTRKRGRNTEGSDVGRHLRGKGFNMCSQRSQPCKVLGWKSLVLEGEAGWNGCNGMNKKGGESMRLQRRCWLGGLAPSRPQQDTWISFGML